MCTEKLPVIFRNDGGEIVAVFPTLPGADWTDMTCYAHIGQHAACSFDWYYTTKPAKPTDYNDLYEELQQVYSDCELVVVKRITKSHTEQRKCAAWGE